MSWFHQIVGPHVTVRVQAHDGSILTKRVLQGGLDGVRNEQLRVNPRVAEVHIFNPDGSYTVWFHHRRDDLFTRPRSPLPPKQASSPSWTPGLKPA